MADREISSLRKVSQISADTLFPAYVHGSDDPAQAVTGEQIIKYALDSVQEDTKSASASAAAAAASAYRAQQDADKAQDAQTAIENMGVRADTLEAGSAATVRKEIVNGTVRLTYGIPQGPQGEVGPRGAQGVQGPPGPSGGAGIVVPISGHFGLHVDDTGHLILTYTGDDAPNMYIDDNGHLIWQV